MRLVDLYLLLYQWRVRARQRRCERRGHRWMVNPRQTFRICLRCSTHQYRDD